MQMCRWGAVKHLSAPSPLGKGAMVLVAEGEASHLQARTPSAPSNHAPRCQ